MCVHRRGVVGVDEGGGSLDGASTQGDTVEVVTAGTHQDASNLQQTARRIPCRTKKKDLKFKLN